MALIPPIIPKAAFQNVPAVLLICAPGVLVDVPATFELNVQNGIGPILRLTGKS